MPEIGGSPLISKISKSFPKSQNMFPKSPRISVEIKYIPCSCFENMLLLFYLLGIDSKHYKLILLLKMKLKHNDLILQDMELKLDLEVSLCLNA
ncbi:unnamed protein product [Pneumocystis jirovecii]|uniref:Uncharacterized protein n=1 Tax=Pneumocystis jirovecii TaxID=42068 RepID=L0P952_PNEJI|nr:unnamed protein product [Pneumocystis jirovecii]